MMRPDELQKKMDAVEDLRRTVQNLRRVSTICGGRLNFNGHPAVDLNEREAEVVRQALMAHHQDKVTIKANLLRDSGIDPSSLMAPATPSVSRPNLSTPEKSNG